MQRLLPQAATRLAPGLAACVNKAAGVAVLQHARRGFASTPGAGFVEIREYTLKPEGIKDFMDISMQYKDLRTSNLPFLGMFSCDTGGTLNRVVHFYNYDSFTHRDAVRGALAKNDAWQNEYLAKTRPTVAHQESKIMKEATGVYAAAGLPPTAAEFECGGFDGDATPMWELREYQLIPGYATVPTLLKAFEGGLPAKLAADDSGGQLAFLGYTDVGMLNNVVELWRYPSAQACIRAREKARPVQEWREAIGSIAPLVQHFRSSYMHATKFSPWQ